MLNELINIIKLLNNGSVLPDQSDADSKENLNSEMVSLYIDKKHHKFYYFAEFVVDELTKTKNNLVNIEKIINDKKTTNKNSKDYLPENSYLILLWKVANINEDIYPLIMKQEENVFFYKKYVFYYEEEEYRAFIDWRDGLGDNIGRTLKDLISEINKSTVDFEKPHIRFLARLIIKIPFCKLTFPKRSIENLEGKIIQEINIATGESGEKVKELNNMISNLIESECSDTESIANKIYDKMMEESNS